MPQPPFKFIIGYLKDKIDRNRKDNEFIHTQTDGFITWIIGFAFSGLLLLSANINNLNLKDRTPTKPILICIVLTIVLGIVFRYVSYLIIVKHKALDDYFFGLFPGEGMDMTPITVDPDIKEAGFDEMVKFLKDDFDVQITYSEPLSKAQQQDELPRLKEYYTKLVEHSKKMYDIGVQYLANVNETAYKIKAQETLRKLEQGINNPRIGFNLKRWVLVRTVLYTLCLLSFLAGVLILFFSIFFM
jgi:hypothetical protein